MSYIGDFNVNQTVYLPIPSTNANGTPTALANGTVVIYKNNGTTEHTANFTLTASFDSRPGLNLLTVITSGNTTFFASGADYFPVLTVGDVNSVSVANMALPWFSIENRSGSNATHLAQLSGANSSATSMNTTLLGASFLETNVSLQGGLRMIGAAVAGKLSGAGTTTMNMTNFAGNVTVLSVTVDGNGNRTLVTSNTSY